MRDLLPQRLRRWGGDTAGATIVTPIDLLAATPDVTITQRQRGVESKLGRFTLDASGIFDLRRAAARGRRRPVILQLPAETLLERRIVLPLAAERDLGSVLQYEIDRITPFRSNEIFWRYHVEQRDRPNARLNVRLSLIPKAPLMPLLDALEAAGQSASMLEVRSRNAAPCMIDLDRTASTRDIWARRSLVAGGCLCGGLVVAVVILPFILQSLAAGRVEQRITSLRPAVAQAETLRQQIAAGASGIDVMAAERSRVGDALAVLAAVTTALPDDTYLNSITLRQGHLTITGQSAAAARLIGALSTDPTIRNASFDAPVTRAEQAKADLFSIRADVAAEPAAVAR